MSDSDALMWSIEKDPALRSTITAVILLDGPPDRERFTRLVERGTRVVPRLRQRVRSNTLSIAPPRWEVDPNFDLHFHLRWVRATGDGSLRRALDLAEPVAMQGFDRARPLWEITVVEGLEDDGAALVVKLHHTITDGVGSIKIALILFELEREPAEEPDMPLAPEVHVMGQVERLLDALRYEQRRSMGIAGRSVGAAASAAAGVLADPPGSVGRATEAAASVLRMVQPATAPLSPLMTRRSLSVHFDTVSVSLADAKRAARRAEGTLNDVFLAATAEGFRRYHEEMGQPAEALRLNMPISVRTTTTQDLAGNQFVPARFPIPLGIADPIERMRTLHELVARQRHEPALALVDPMAGLLNRLPTSLTTAVFGGMLKGVDLTASNVPGAPIPIYIAGAGVRGMFAFGPMTGAAANLTLLSYLDQVHVGVNLDPAAVTEPDRFLRCYREAWAEVLAAGEPTARRRRARPRAGAGTTTASKRARTSS